jgi:hypothetical protein
MQTSVENQASGAPDLAPLAPRTIQTVGADGKPITIQVPHTVPEMEQLVARRTELSNQLESVTDRRNDLARELNGVGDGQARTGILDRLKILDQRTLQLESDIATTSQQIASAPAALAQISEEDGRGRGNGDDWTEGLGLGSFGTAFVFVIVMVMRRRRRKGNRQDRQSIQPDESAQRLQRLEQGMEAIAIEIERVSEGQRFVTKLLSEQAPLNGKKIAVPAEANRDR